MLASLSCKPNANLCVGHYTTSPGLDQDTRLPCRKDHRIMLESQKRWRIGGYGSSCDYLDPCAHHWGYSGGLSGHCTDKMCTLWPVRKNWRDTAEGELFQVGSEKLRSEVDVRKSRDCASSRHDDAGLGATCTGKRSCLHLW